MVKATEQADNWSVTYKVQDTVLRASREKNEMEQGWTCIHGPKCSQHTYDPHPERGLPYELIKKLQKKADAMTRGPEVPTE